MRTNSYCFDGLSRRWISPAQGAIGGLLLACKPERRFAASLRIEFRAFGVERMWFAQVAYIAVQRFVSRNVMGVGL